VTTEFDIYRTFIDYIRHLPPLSYQYSIFTTPFVSRAGLGASALAAAEAEARLEALGGRGHKPSTLNSQ